VPRLGISPLLKFQTPRSRLGLETERLGLGLGLDIEGLGLGSKRLGLVGKHFSITYIKLCLNMPLRFSLSSRLPPLLFRITSVLGMMWTWDVASVLTSRSRGRLEAPRLGLASELIHLGLVSVSSSEGLGLGLASV